MIADEEMYVNAFVCERFECLQERTVLLFALITPEILAPEIKHIPQQVDGSGILSHAIEHVNQGLLMGFGILNSPRTQMCVTQKIYHIY